MACNTCQRHMRQELGLTRINQLLAHVPLTWRAIHVAGTNGKGSVCAYVSAMLERYNQSPLRRHTGHPRIKHARFVSPHLIDRWDCITINGQTIDESTFLQVEALVKDRDRREAINASEFEILTATAFEIFTRQSVDIGVIEVGLGGRLDATNIIGQPTDTKANGATVASDASSRPLPLVTGITSIALDHQNLLGSTLREIAREKAGIIKQGVPVVVAEQISADVIPVIQEKAAANDATDVTVVSKSTTLRDIWLQNGIDSNGATSVLAGRPIQQRWPNGALAVQLTLKALARSGRLTNAKAEDKIQLSEDFARVPEVTLWAGRLQSLDVTDLVGFACSITIDGAHNLDAARILRDFVAETSGSRPVEWVIAMSKGKDAEEILRTLIGPEDVLNAVEFGPVDGMPWVSPAQSQQLVEVCRAVKGEKTSATRPEAARTDECRSNADEEQFVTWGTDVEKALITACRRAKQHDRKVVVAGSLYLVGDVLRLLRTRQNS